MSTKQRRCSGCFGYFPEDVMIRKKGKHTTTFRCKSCHAAASLPQAERDAAGKVTAGRLRKSNELSLNKQYLLPTGFKTGR